MKIEKEQTPEIAPEMQVDPIVKPKYSKLKVHQK